MNIKIILPLPPKALHAHNQGRWQNKTSATRKYREAAFLIAKSIMPPIVQMPKAVLQIDFFWATRHKRDVLNAAQGLKPAIDGLVDAGLLPNDDWTVLEVGHIRPHIDKENPRVILTFCPPESLKA